MVYPGKSKPSSTLLMMMAMVFMILPMSTALSYTYSTDFDDYSFLPFTTNGYYSWTLNRYGTGSANTGPSGDHTSGDGYYAYVEASSPNNPNGGPFILSLNVTTDIQNAHFYYSMYGADMGYLLFQTSSDSGSTWTSRWAKSGNQGTSWHYANVSISDPDSDSITNARFYAITGDGWSSDIAIDDVYVICSDDDDGGDDGRDDVENSASSVAIATGLSFGVIGATLLLGLICYLFYTETSPKVREKRSIVAAARAKCEDDSACYGSYIESSSIQPQDLNGTIIGEGTGTS